jgi:pyruvate,water dikinase
MARRTVVKGMPASPGVASGKAKLIMSVADMGKMNEGDILVSPLTNPTLTPAIFRASAIVTEIGGTLSHAAIVSREIGIPCVVGTGNATSIITDGMEITVDGSQGVVLQSNS